MVNGVVRTTSTGPTAAPGTEKENDTYPLQELAFGPKEIKDRRDGVLGPLTLFAPYHHENVPEVKPVELERPVTPIDDEIKAPPPTFEHLCKLVRRRVAPKAEVEALSMDDQKELSAIVMGEINAIWKDLRQQVNDPFLSPAENKELQRRITVHIVTVCEQLFLHYLDKAAILARRGVFSGPANMSRLKAQLSLDLHKFLNVLIIRRYIVADLKGTLETEADSTAAIPVQPATKISYKGFLQESRPKSRSKKTQLLTLEQEMKLLTDAMPTLDATRLLPLIEDLPEPRSGSHTSESTAAIAKRLQTERTQKKVQQEQSAYEKLVLHKCDSLPHLGHVGETLLEELGIDTDRHSALSMDDLPEDDVALTDRSTGQPGGRLSPVPEQAAPGTREYIAEDLRRLMAVPEDGAGEEDEDDLPPLLQALTRSAKHDGKKEWVQQQLRELEERERERREAETVAVREPSHPQPATVTNQIGGKMVVRTSDIRVSERVCLSSITLKKNSTVYNDLLDEIDPETVKKLDSNLFLGNEINEVYREIMKTMPTDHLDMENDEHIMEPADSVNLTAALASATLGRKRDERLINPQLQRRQEPPWGALGVNEWIKTPMSPPKDFRGRPIIQPMMSVHDGKTPRAKKDEWHDLLGSKAEQYMPPPPPPPAPNPADMGLPLAAAGTVGGGASASERPSALHEYMSRTYASWLSWWKNTINSDDYMKFLSTQESDYMGVIFHFYNSDDEDEDEEDARSPSKPSRKSLKMLEEEKMRRLESLRAEKEEFTPGMWNCQSVFLGGLGRDPDLEEDEGLTVVSKAASSTDTDSKLTRSRSLVVSRRSARREDSTLSPKRGQTLESERAVSRRTQGTQDIQTEVPDEAGGSPDPQDRLEKVWNMLRMPDAQRLDMAIKYSSNQWYPKLDQAVDEWEDAAELVLQREVFIAKLEKFERLASDPNRFFEKGQRGSSVARLQEAKIRSAYYKKIDQIERDLKKQCERIKRDFEDDVTFQGRGYADKMAWDRTEMLYWLQEERKQQALEHEARMRGLPELPRHMVQLEPINAM